MSEDMQPTLHTCMLCGAKDEGVKPLGSAGVFCTDSATCRESRLDKEAVDRVLAVGIDVGNAAFIKAAAMVGDSWHAMRGLEMSDGVPVPLRGLLNKLDEVLREARR